MKTFGYLVTADDVSLYFRNNPPSLKGCEIVELVAKPAPLPTCAQLEEFKKQAMEIPTHWDFSLAVDLTGKYPQWYFRSSYTQEMWYIFLQKKGPK